MRDEVIELIDADPDAFGALPRRAVEPRSPAGRRRRALALAIAFLAGLGTYTLFSARPWAGPGPRRTFDDSHPSTSTLSDHLLLDIPVNQVRATTLHTQAIPAAKNLAASGAVGYFFGDKDATFDTGDGKDRWMGLYGLPADSAAAPSVGNPTDTIAGAPASIETSDSSVTQLVWGPVDGWIFTAAAANLSKNEVISLADQVRIQKGKVVVLNHAGMGRLQPIGRFADYWTLVNLVQRAQQNGVHLDGMVGVFYNTGSSIASLPANKSTIAMVRFVLGSATDPPEAKTVHGKPALGFAKGKGAFSGLPASTVVWWEGGRLVQVSGEGTLDDVVKLAQTAHVASASDWTAVSTVE